MSVEAARDWTISWPSGGLEVEGDALLAAVAAGGAEGGDAHGAEGVAADGLDLDDARAEVGEEGGAEGGGDDGRELEDGDAREGRAGGGGEGRRGWGGAGGFGEDLGGVLAGLGAGLAGGAGGGGEAGERADLAHGPEGGVLALDDVAVEDEVGVVEGLLRALEGGGGDAAVLDEGVHPLVGGVFEHALEHAVAEALAGVLRPERGAALVVGVGEDVGKVDGGEVVIEEVGHEVAELEPAPVLRLEGVVVEGGHDGHDEPREDLGEAVAELGAVEPAEVVGEEALQEAGLDELAAAALLAGHEGGEDAVEGGLGGGVGAGLDGGVGGALAVGEAAEGEHASEAGGDDGLVAGVAGVGTLAPEAGDGAVDERGVAGPERLVVRAQRLRLAGAAARHDDVGAPGEAGEGLAALVGLEVEDGAALPPQPHGRVRDGAPGVAAGAFDLDDIGAEIGEHHGGNATDGAFAQVENAEIVEQFGHGDRPRG